MAEFVNAEECPNGDGKQDGRDQQYDHDLDESATGMGTERVVPKRRARSPARRAYGSLRTRRCRCRDVTFGPGVLRKTPSPLQQGVSRHPADLQFRGFVRLSRKEERIVMAPSNAKSANEDVFEFVRKSEEAVLEVGRRWAETLSDFVPAEVPLAREMTKQVLEFLEELLKIQRDFAEQVFDETTKAATKTAKAAKKTTKAAKKTTKAATKTAKDAAKKVRAPRATKRPATKRAPAKRAPAKRPAAKKAAASR
jgi:hypothetical protein